MKQRSRTFLFFTFFILLGVIWNYSLADDDEHEEKSGHRYNLNRGIGKGDPNPYRKKHNDHDGRYLKPVNNSTYEAGCGECHFLYQPELLPSASWMKILDQLDDHFGEGVDLDPDSINIIADYLKSNGAEKSPAKRAVKIMRSIGNHVPLRITDIPYIREKHHELPPDVFKRESIGSLSNCIACHPTAEKGIYDDDNVKIPR
jgi:hypothetical protein